jgi:hypothetical protein
MKAILLKEQERISTSLQDSRDEYDIEGITYYVGQSDLISKLISLYELDNMSLEELKSSYGHFGQ